MRKIWDRLRYFSPDENWGEYWRINGTLLLLLDNLRDLWQAPFVIHCGTQGKHVQHSFHYKGMAVDFHIATNESFFIQVIKTLELLAGLQVDEFVGLGVYPQWNHPGFHLDVRGYRARWGMLNGKYVGLQQVLDYLREKDSRGGRYG